MTTTPVWLKVPHDVAGVLPRHRSITRTRITQEHPFAVREVEGANTRLVAELRRNCPILVRGGEQSFVWREHEGRLYRSLLAAHGGQVWIGADARPFYGKPGLEAAYPADRIDYPFGGGAQRSSMRGYNSILSLPERNEAAPGNFRLPLEQDGWPRALAVAQAYAEKLLLIDGLLHVEAPPPRWALFSTDLGGGNFEEADCFAFVPDYDDWRWFVWASTDPSHLAALFQAISENPEAEMTFRRGREELHFHGAIPDFDPRPVMASALFMEAMSLTSDLSLSQADPVTGAALGMMRLSASRAPAGWSSVDQQQFDDAISMLGTDPGDFEMDMFGNTQLEFLSRRESLVLIARQYKAILEVAEGLTPDIDQALADLPGL